MSGKGKNITVKNSQIFTIDLTVNNTYNCNMKRKLRILKPFKELMSENQVKYIIMRYKTKQDNKPVSKKYFLNEKSAREYFEENKAKKNLILTKGM